MRLLLARHGETSWNAQRRFQGSTDVGLSERGRGQALGLRRGLCRFRLAAAYVSPMGRARETATIALGGAPPPLVVLEDLRELCLGEWEGHTVDEIRRRHGDPYLAWLRAPLDCPPPGGEPLPDVARRVVGALDRIAAAHPGGEDVLVLAHGGVISVYVCLLLGVSLNTLWRVRVDNASITVVRPPRLVTVNDTTHLGDGRGP